MAAIKIWQQSLSVASGSKGNQIWTGLSSATIFSEPRGEGGELASMQSFFQSQLLSTFGWLRSKEKTLFGHCNHDSLKISRDNQNDRQIPGASLKNCYSEKLFYPLNAQKCVHKTAYAHSQTLRVMRWAKNARRKRVPRLANPRLN